MGTNAVQPILNWGQRVRALPNEIAHPIDTIENYLHPAPAQAAPSPVSPPRDWSAFQAADARNRAEQKQKLYSRNSPAKAVPHGR